MPTSPSAQQSLDPIRQLELDYKWLEAAEAYEKAASSPADDERFSADLVEKTGYAYYMAARQAESRDEFGKRIQSAIVSYQKSRQAYEKMLGQDSGKALGCAAMVSFLKLWLSSDPSVRRLLIREAWTLAERALQQLGRSSDAVDYCNAFLQLSPIPEFAWLYEPDPKVLEKMLREATHHGERVVQLTSAQNSREIARAFTKTASLIKQHGWYIQDYEEKLSRFKLAEKYWARAKELDEVSAHLELSFASYEFPGGEGTDEAFDTWLKTLKLGRSARDRLLVSSAQSMLAYHSSWRAIGTAEPDGRARLMEEALGFAQDCQRELQPIPMPCPATAVLWPQAPLAEYHWLLGGWEPDLEKKQALWQRSVSESAEMLKQALESGFPQAILNSHHVFSKALASAASVEKSPAKKEELLKHALEQRDLCIDLSSQIEPYNDFNHAVYRHYQSEIASQLSDLSKDSDYRKRLLQEAADHKRSSIKLYRKTMSTYEGFKFSLPNVVWLAEREYENGNLLVRLHEQNMDRSLLDEAVTAFSEAAGLFEKANFASRTAESYWRVAQVHDALNDYVKAAEEFLLASESYMTALEKLPRLAELYRNHAQYMEAWSEIEKARNYHHLQENSSAKECYERAANLHSTSKRWGYLAPNYSAWAMVEESEDLSRRERCSEAMQAFEKAAKRFGDAQSSLRNQQANTTDPQEKQAVSNLEKAVVVRQDYCRARAILEEAKLLDRKGDHHASSKKFGKVAEALSKIVPALEIEQDKREMDRIVTLARAWQMMTGAEAEASPGLYLEAARLFEKAKELSQTEKGKLVALGHSRFCKALESGARFADTRDRSLYDAAMQNLESASNYYLKAGFQNASEYTQACKLLFDGYAYMDRANQETDQEKKAKLYTVAEKLLEASANHFDMAEYQAKKDEVLRLLEKVRDEGKLAASLTDVFRAPSSLSFESRIATPTKTEESPVGWEQFEHARVEASLVLRQKELKVGENLDLEVELVNAGKSPAQLVKLESLLLEGFQLTRTPESYRVEDSYLNLKGKRLDPLKTEEVRLTLRAMKKGQFTIRPRILYLDEGGTYKSHEPEPVTVTVKELGISGWVKGR